MKKSCPKCGKILIDYKNDGTKKLRSKMLLFKAEATIAICPSCKNHVDVPVKLNLVINKY